MEENKNNETTSKKSLFSIQVDDVIMQRIFKTLEDEIKNLTKELSEVKSELKQFATKQDVSYLSERVVDLQIKTDEYSTKVNENITTLSEEFTKSLKETKQNFDDQLSDAIFSVNNAVRAQNSLIEEKIFFISQPSIEFGAIKSDVSQLKKDNLELKSQNEKIQNFFFSFVKDMNIESGSQYTLPSVIQYATKEDHEQIAKLSTAYDEFESKIKSFSQRIDMLIGPEVKKLPEYGKANRYPSSEKPKIPTLPSPKSFFDYFEYLMKLAPSIQKVFNCFYRQINKINEKMNDESERISQFKQIDQAINKMYSIKDEFDKKLDEAINQNQLKEISKKVNNMEDKFVEKSLFNEIRSIVDELPSKYATREELDEVTNDFHASLNNIINNYDQKFESLSYKNDSLPAIAAVSPRGKASFNMIYGGYDTSPRDGPKIIRVSKNKIKKEEIEEVGKSPRRTPRNPTRVQLGEDQYSLQKQPIHGVSRII